MLSDVMEDMALSSMNITQDGIVCMIYDLF